MKTLITATSPPCKVSPSHERSCLHGGQEGPSGKETARGAPSAHIYPTPLTALRASTRNKYLIMHPYTPRYRTVMRAYESGVPRRTLLGIPVPKALYRSGL